MSRTLAVLAATAVAALAACGTASPDLFVVRRGGTVPGARLALLVSDTSVRCNGGPAHPLSSAQIIVARELHKDLLELQTEHTPIPPSAPAQIFTYAVRSEEGTLRFADSVQRPLVLARIAQFTRRTAIDVCGLKR